jgi:hypothetical protein
VEVNCTSTVSKPAANLRWVYKNESLLGRQVSVLDNITKTYTVTSILEMQAVADDNGRSVLCIVSHPLLVNQTPSNASVDLKILCKLIIFIVTLIWTFHNRKKKIWKRKFIRFCKFSSVKFKGENSFLNSKPNSSIQFQSYLQKFNVVCKHTVIRIIHCGEITFNAIIDK